MTVFKWSTTAASNATIDDTINARENQAPSTVNDAMRAIMAAIAKWRGDLSGNLVTDGSSTAYTLTTNQGFTSLTDGLSVRARLNAANGAAATLNVDGTGAKALASVYGTAMPEAALLSGGVYDFVYDSTDDKWIVVVPVVTRESLGLATSDSPQFTAVNIGAASDTTITRVGAGDIAVEGNAIYRAGGTDVSIADGGTGASTASAAFNALKQQATTSATGVVELAVKAEIEAATDADRVAALDMLKHHPGVAKFHVAFDEDGTIENSYNVASVTKNATGNFTVSLTTAFASSTWTCVATCEDTSTDRIVRIESKDASSVTLRINRATLAAVDTGLCVVGYGLQ